MHGTWKECRSNTYALHRSQRGLTGKNATCCLGIYPPTFNLFVGLELMTNKFGGMSRESLRKPQNIHEEIPGTSSFRCPVCCNFQYEWEICCMRVASASSVLNTHWMHRAQRGLTSNNATCGLDNDTYRFQMQMIPDVHLPTLILDHVLQGSRLWLASSKNHCGKLCTCHWISTKRSWVNDAFLWTGWLMNA